VEEPAHCHGEPSYCGWQLTGEAVRVEALSRGVLNVNPTVAPHFDPVCCYLLGIDANQPSINRRFLVSSVTIGGQPQLAIEEPNPNENTAALLSDVFNRPDQPVLVEWGYFSAETLGAPLNIKIFNLNASPIWVHSAIWGNAIDQAFMNHASRTDPGKRLCGEAQKRKYELTRVNGSVYVRVLR
jgi:hypothetical protein